MEKREAFEISEACGNSKTGSRIVIVQYLLEISKGFRAKNKVVWASTARIRR